MHPRSPSTRTTAVASLWRSPSRPTTLSALGVAMHATGAVLATHEPFARPIRVASVPFGHVYVRHLSDPRDDGAVIRLPDIPQRGDDSDPGRWWPPVMLDADWIAAN